MTTKIWRVDFGDNYTSIDVVASNAKEAIYKAIAHRRGENAYLNRLQDVTSVELLAEADA